jgi:redox-sensitive bicupin YhaK (pirin superfamily)
MIQVIPAASKYNVDQGWLRSQVSFSFGEYYDPNNSEFSVMRVCNDDNLAPGRGFGAHPHSDMEIVTIVLEGQIRHEDNLGNVAVTAFGEVQRMTAGSGMIHTEYNASSTEELSLLQLWFLPRARGLAPSYQTSRFDPAHLVNTWHPVVSPKGSEHATSIEQDLTIYLSKLEKGRELLFEQGEGRNIFLFVIEGELSVNGEKLAVRDEARIEHTGKLHVAAEADAFIMLIDLP